MTRRKLLQGLLAAAIWTAWKERGFGAESSPKPVKRLQENWKALLAEGAKVPLPSEPLKLSKEEWRKRLDPMQFYVLREEGTERAGTSPLNDEKRPGVFACVGCDLPLFTSEMK
jgi:peptide-methionine (R)-S-oxide reductase